MKNHYITFPASALFYIAETADADFIYVSTDTIVFYKECILLIG